jgi:NAD+ diphosphatase
MGFYCDLDSDDEQVTLDQLELSMAAWYRREEIPVGYEDCSLTNEMIMKFKENR